MSGLEETLRAYELNPFGQVDIEVMQKPRVGDEQTQWQEGQRAGGTQTAMTEVVVGTQEPWVGDTQTTTSEKKNVVIGPLSITNTGYSFGCVDENGAVSN